MIFYMRAARNIKRPWRELANVRGATMLLLVFMAARTQAADIIPTLRGKWDSPADAWKVRVQNNVAFVANDVGGLAILSVTNPANPVLLATYNNVNDDAVVDIALGRGLSTNYAYLAVGSSGVDVINISNPSSPQFVGNIPVDVDYLDVQANAVLVSPGGNNLFVADDFAGIKIFKISQPTNLDNTILLGAADTFGTAYGLAFNAATSDLLYVANGEGGLAQVIVQNLASPVTTLTAELPGNGRSVVNSGSSIFVACEDGGLQVVNSGTFLVTRQFLTSSSIYDVFSQNGTLYLACTDGGVVVTAATPVNRIGGYQTSASGSAYGLTMVGTNLFVAAGGLNILNTNLLANPQRLGNFYDLVNGSEILAVALKGNDAFVSDASFGLQVIKVTSPASPVQLVGTTNFATADPPTSITIVSNIAFMTEGNAGLEIVDITDVTNLVTSSLFDTPGYANEVAIDGNFAYIADGGSGMEVVDISDPEFPVLQGTNAIGGYSSGILVTNGLAYLADGNKGLRVLDVSNPAHPLEIGRVSTVSNANDVALSGNYAFLADGAKGLSVIDVANPTNPVQVASLDTGDFASGISINGNYAYLAANQASLLVIDIRNPVSPRRVGGNTSFDAPYDVTIYSNKVYVAAGIYGMPVLDLFHSVQPSNSVSIITQPQGLTKSYGENAYFGVTADGIEPFSYQWRKNGVGIAGATNLVYRIVSVTLTNEGNYDVVVTNSYSSITSSVAKLTVVAGITLGNLNQTYDGSAKSVSVTTSPAGLPVNVTYGGFAYAPTNSGNYTVVATVVDPIYKGSATNTLTIAKASVTFTLGNLAQIYTGTARLVTVSTVPAGLTYSLTYNGSANAPTNVGSYKVVGTVNNTNYIGGSTDTLMIGLAPQNFKISPAIGSFYLTLNGTPNFPYALQAATNLADNPVQWHPIYTNRTATNGLWSYVETNLNRPQQYYRATQP